MHMIGHENPAPDVNLRGPAMTPQKVKIKLVVVLAKKCPRPSIAALRDMMRNTGDDDATDPCLGQAETDFN